MGLFLIQTMMILLKNFQVGVGAMAQPLKTLTARGPEFNSQQLHGDSQPAVIGSGMPSSGLSEDSDRLLVVNLVKK